MTSSKSNPNQRPAHLSLPRRLRRTLVTVRVSPITVPSLLLFFYAVLMFGLSQVADLWIVAIAATPLFFALLLTLGCWVAYRRDFYA